MLTLNDIEQALPKANPIRLRSEADFYGTSHLISDSLGRRKPPRSRAAWQHGWASEPISDARQIIGDHDRGHPILVANRRVESFLCDQGVPATAVGLPIVYTPPVDVPRHDGTLLVMPAHVTRNSTLTIDQSEYVDYVCEVSRDFEFTYACVSQQCFERGFWVDAFQNAGIESLPGAGIDDKNALMRMKALMSQFDAVTSNAVGSHLVYAGWCGCRVSLAGPEHKVGEEDYKNEPFYINNPDLLPLVVQRSRHEVLWQHYPMLHRSPGESVTCQPWAAGEIGQDCRRPPVEIATLLKWGAWDRLRLRTGEIVRKNLRRKTR